MMFWFLSEFFFNAGKKGLLCHILWWWIFFCFWSLHDRTVSKFDDLVSFRPPCYQQHTIVFSENKFVSFCREHWNSTLLITLTHMLLKRLVQVWSPVQFFTVCKWLVCEFSVSISTGGPSVRWEEIIKYKWNVRERDSCLWAVLCYKHAIYKGLYGNFTGLL